MSRAYSCSRQGESGEDVATSHDTQIAGQLVGLGRSIAVKAQRSARQMERAVTFTSAIEVGPHARTVEDGRRGTQTDSMIRTDLNGPEEGPVGISRSPPRRGSARLASRRSQH